jgi:hypothetical protein
MVPSAVEALRIEMTSAVVSWILALLLSYKRNVIGLEIRHGNLKF